MRTQTNFTGGHGALSWGALLEGLRDVLPSAYFAVFALVVLGSVAVWAGRNSMKKP